MLLASRCSTDDEFARKILRNITTFYEGFCLFSVGLYHALTLLCVVSFHASSLDIEHSIYFGHGYYGKHIVVFALRRPSCARNL